MLGKKISQNFAINILSMAFGITSSIFIARIGGPAILGNISLAMSFQVLVKSIFTHTINSAHLKVYSEDNQVGLKNFLFASIFYNIITSFLILLFVGWNLSSSNGTFTDLQITLIVIFILQDYLFTPLYIYITDQQSKLNILRANLVDFSAQTLVNLAKIVAVLVGASEIGIAWYMMGACGISAIYPLIKLLKEKFGTFSFNILKKYIRYSLHISTSTIAYGLLLSFDKVLLGIYAVPAAVIGYYNVGNRLGLMIMTLGVSVGGIFLSVFSQNLNQQNHEKTREQLSKYERFISITFLPAFLVAILLGKELIALVFGVEYVLAYPVLIFSIFMAYTKTVTTPYQNYLFVYNRFKAYNRTSIAFAFAIIGCTILFAHFNLFGDMTVSVAAALFLATIIERILFVIEAKQVDRNVKFTFHPAITLFFACFIGGWYLVEGYVIELPALLSYGIRLVILLLVIPLGFALGVYTRADVELILKLAKR